MSKEVADVLLEILGLDRVADRDVAEYVATRVPVTCQRCGRGRSKSMGCPTKCKCQHCHGRKCKGECVAVATMDAAVRGKR